MIGDHSARFGKFGTRRLLSSHQVAAAGSISCIIDFRPSFFLTKLESSYPTAQSELAKFCHSNKLSLWWLLLLLLSNIFYKTISLFCNRRYNLENAADQNEKPMPKFSILLPGMAVHVFKCPKADRGC